MIRREGRLYPTPVTRYGNHPVVESLGMSDDAVDRWDRNRTVYIADLQPTAIVGDRVVVEYEDPVRCMALIPVWDGPDRVASLVATSPESHALSPQQIAGLEALGRLAGPALQDCSPAPRFRTARPPRFDSRRSAVSERSGYTPARLSGSRPTLGPNEPRVPHGSQASRDGGPDHSAPGRRPEGQY